MSKQIIIKSNRLTKGVALFIVLGSIIIVISLASVILTIVSSQSRFTHHQVSRIQAYYADLAGVNYAIEKLRLANDNTCWPATGTYTRRICRSGCSGCNINEGDLPNSVSQVDITVGQPGAGISGTRQISATATYTYTLP
jgi:Tfp pilus assembly protein PilX